MDPYNSDHDDYLLYLIYQMDENSLQVLLKKYTAVNKSQLHFYLSKEELSGNEEDCLAEMYTVILKAVYSYRPDLNARFSTFYSYFVNHYIADFRRQLWGRQGKYHSRIISLDGYVNDESDMCVGSFVVNRDITLEGIYTLYLEQCRYVLRTIFRHLNPMECQVVLLKLDGHSYEYIGEKLNMDLRQVEYILAKVRKSKALIDYHKTLC